METGMMNKSAATTAGSAATRLRGRGRTFASHETPAAEDDAAHGHPGFWVSRERKIAHALLILELLNCIAFIGGDGFVEVGHLDLVG